MSFAPSTSNLPQGEGSSKGSGEYFPDVPKVEYKGPESKDPLSYRYYNADEVIMGRPMKDWLRFSICFWHTFRGNGADPFGFPTASRAWDVSQRSNTEEAEEMVIAKQRVDAAFELFTKLGVEYYCFHDRDVAPEGISVEESKQNLKTVVSYLKEKQEATGVKLLWATQNLFSHPRYMNGAFTNPDVNVVAYAGAAVKTVLDINNELGGENVVFWGGREGYQSLLNTNVKRELDHMAAMLRMAVDYAQRNGHTAQFLLEPKPREPTKHQYDYDAQTCIGFLKHYGLEKHFKLNIEPNHTTLAGHEFEHDITVASQYGMLGSVDSNTGDTLLGWDTDQFPMDIKQATKLMGVVLHQGGLQPGGLNFDCKVRRESTDTTDIAIGHIGAMDTFARGLRIAAQIRADGTLPKMIADRYSSFDSGFGKDLEDGKLTLEDCEEYAIKIGEPKQTSGKQELFECILNQYM